ncbi:hypothetical protein DFA_07358 [Cavenderia fasciculata]|uniref:Cytochrome c oxidase assembly factor 5 n=1 Tax=Cavenderia fasciculata TaxID=261658 RepID=F4PW73_CACFS|nr:uncharacterized protein DFA_07358 [Cavenderia fasciculata]EGG20237.1 hypothetical protein DFA_07358 [Cavenderia fasciculata]|eukprot:XP_004367220.1 hypothetical protein DFA_07358 [Cavenderia fasciculata]
MSSPQDRIDTSKGGHPCQRIKDAIVKCINDSQCMQPGDRTFHQCMKANDLQQECKDLLYTYYQCKMDMITKQFDTRSRFRGNVTANTWEKDVKKRIETPPTPPS